MNESKFRLSIRILIDLTRKFLIRPFSTRIPINLTKHLFQCTISVDKIKISTDNELSRAIQSSTAF